MTRRILIPNWLHVNIITFLLLLLIFILKMFHKLEKYAKNLG